MPRERRRLDPTPTSCLVPMTLVSGTNCLILTDVSCLHLVLCLALGPTRSYDRVIVGGPRRLVHAEIVRHVWRAHCACMSRGALQAFPFLLTCTTSQRNSLHTDNHYLPLHPCCITTRNAAAGDDGGSWCSSVKQTMAPTVGAMRSVGYARPYTIMKSTTAPDNIAGVVVDQEGAYT